MEIVTTMFDGIEMTNDMKVICIMFCFSVMLVLGGIIFDMFR